MAMQFQKKVQRHALNYRITPKSDMISYQITHSHLYIHAVDYLGSTTFVTVSEEYILFLTVCTKTSSQNRR